MIEFDLPNETYRARPGLSHSEAKLLRQRTPYHVHMLREHRAEAPPRKPTPQMMLGTAVHCLVLEPSTFETRYCDDLDESKNSKLYKEFAREAQATGLTPISRDDRERVFDIRDSLLSNEQIADSLSTGRAEVSAWFTDPASGVLCKCRPDFVRPTRGGRGSLLVDLKTTSDASRDMFSKSIASFGYHTQADYYVNGYAIASNRPVDGMLFIVVETEFPYACAAYTLDDEALEQASRLNAQARATYAECLRTGIWPGYGDGVQDIGLPRWALREGQ